MDFYQILEHRRSIRSYMPDPVPDTALMHIAAAVRCAPSACNKQPWRFLIIRRPDLRARVAACYHNAFLGTAPAIVAVLGNREACYVRKEGDLSLDIDVGIAMEHLVLAATAEGLSTCWICAYERKQVERVLDVAAPWTVVALTPLGYAAEPPKPINYKPTAEIFQVID